MSSDPSLAGPVLWFSRLPFFSRAGWEKVGTENQSALPERGGQSRMFRFLLEIHVLPLPLKVYLALIPYLPFVSEMLKDFPPLSCMIQLLYLAFLFLGEFLILYLAAGNPIVRVDFLLIPSFIPLFTVTTQNVTRSWMCLVLRSPNHLGLDDVPIIGTWIHQCIINSSEFRKWNWVGWGISFIALLYVEATLIILLKWNALQITNYAIEYHKKLQSPNSAWKAFWVSILKLRGGVGKKENRPLPRFIFARKTRIRKIDDVAQNPPLEAPGSSLKAIYLMLANTVVPTHATFMLVSVHLLLSIATLLETKPLISLIVRVVYVCCFFALEHYIQRSFMGNPILRGSIFLRTALIAQAAAAVYITVRVFVCKSKFALSTNTTPIISHWTMQCSSYSASPVYQRLDGANFGVSTVLLVYVFSVYLAVSHWGRVAILTPLKRYYPAAYGGLPYP